MVSGFILTVVVLFLAGCGYLHTAKFGALPTGERLETIKKSPNYQDGEFKNIEPIPMSTEKSNIVKRLVSYLAARKDRPKPPSSIPTIKTNLMELDRNEDVVIWLGHSSFYLQLAGKRILIDPVLSEDAAPIPWVNEAFAGTNIYSASDFPEIDILLITHDHWDHLDYPTVTALKEKFPKSSLHWVLAHISNAGAFRQARLSKPTGIRRFPWITDWRYIPCPPATTRGEP